MDVNMSTSASANEDIPMSGGNAPYSGEARERELELRTTTGTTNSTSSGNSLPIGSDCAHAPAPSANEEQRLYENHPATPSVASLSQTSPSHPLNQEQFQYGDLRKDFPPSAMGMGDSSPLVPPAITQEQSQTRESTMDIILQQGVGAMMPSQDFEKYAAPHASTEASTYDDAPRVPISLSNDHPDNFKRSDSWTRYQEQLRESGSEHGTVNHNVTLNHQGCDRSELISARQLAAQYTLHPDQVSKDKIVHHQRQQWSDDDENDDKGHDLEARKLSSTNDATSNRNYRAVPRHQHSKQQLRSDGLQNQKGSISDGSGDSHFSKHAHSQNSAEVRSPVQQQYAAAQIQQQHQEQQVASNLPANSNNPARRPNQRQQQPQRRQLQPHLPGAYHMGISAPFIPRNNRRRRGQQQQNDEEDLQRLPSGADIIDDPNDERLVVTASDEEEAVHDTETAVVEVVPEEELEAKFHQRMREQTVQAHVVTVGGDEELVTDDDEADGTRPKPEENGIPQQGKPRKLMIYGTIAVLLIIIIAVISGVVVSSRDKSSGESQDVGDEYDNGVRNASSLPTFSPTMSSPTNTPSMAPTISLMDQLRSQFSTFSDVTLMNTPNTPQYKALEWLFSHTLQEDDLLPSATLQTLSSYSEQELAERYVLAVFYFSTNGPEWKEKFGFLSRNTTVCDWGNSEDGPSSPIDCDEDGRVSILQLVNNSMAGTLPDELVVLAALGTLDFGFNQLSGTIPPSYGTSMGRLVTIDLRSNPFLTGAIPQAMFLGGLNAFQNIYLGRCQFNGTMNFSLSNRLRRIDVSSNLLLGPLPSMNTQSGYKYINFAGNFFSGAIPATFYSQPELNHIDLSNNRLTGSLAAQVGALSSLQELRLSNNKINGAIPVELGNLLELLDLRLDHNGLTGQPPSQIRRLYQLKTLDLSANELTGRLPTELGILEALETLDLSSNAFSGNFPSEVASIDNLKRLAIHNNSLVGDTIELYFCPSDLEGEAESPIAIQADCSEVQCSCCAVCCSDSFGNCTLA